MFSAAAVEKVGTVKAFGGSSAPDGWLFCDGSAISRTTYAALFAVIGTTYGAGDGTTTFNLPNSRLPKDVSIKVLGNGKTLALTSGYNYGGIYVNGNPNLIGALTGLYNKNIGAAASGSSITATIGAGVVTSGESGIYTDLSDSINTIIKY